MSDRNPFDMRRVIIDCHPDNFILATRAARWLIERPEHKDSILSYGEGKSEVVFYAKRNKESISVREQH